MFGRKKKEMQQMQQFAMGTINAKYGIVDAIVNEVNTGFWFEDGQHPAGKKAVLAYCSYIADTEDVVFLTVNSLSPELGSRAEKAASDAMEGIQYNIAMDSDAAAAYRTHNGLLRDLIGVDPFGGAETDRFAADATLCIGAMRHCVAITNRPGVTMGEFAQTVSVACTLLAGWVNTAGRQKLAG